MNLSTATNEQRPIIVKIMRLQDIQKRTPPTDSRWIAASEQLQILFKKMAELTASKKGE